MSYPEIRLTKAQLFTKTRHHFNLPRPFKPSVLIRLSHAGRWEILNNSNERLGVNPDQAQFMLAIIEQHGGLVGGV